MSKEEDFFSLDEAKSEEAFESEKTWYAFCESMAQQGKKPHPDAIAFRNMLFKVDLACLFSCVKQCGNR